MAARIAVVDDNGLVRRLCQECLLQAGFEVKIFHNGEDAMQGLAGWRPDVALVDWCLPGMDGFQCAALLRQTHASTRFIVITGHGDWECLEKVGRGKIDGLLSKPFSGGQLVEAIRAALAADKSGPLFLRMRPQGNSSCVLSEDQAPHLTAREREIMVMVQMNLTDKEIAMNIGLSPRTVSNHLANIFRKSGCTTREEAVQKYFPSFGPS